MRYLNFRGIGLCDKEAMEYCRYPLNPDYEIFPGIYLQPHNLGGLTKAVDLEELGSFDFAVPQYWAEANNFPKGLDLAVWLYRRESRIFGEPFTVRQMLDRLREMIKKEAVQFWFEQKGETNEIV